MEIQQVEKLLCKSSEKESKTEINSNVTSDRTESLITQDNTQSKPKNETLSEVNINVNTIISNEELFSAIEQFTAELSCKEPELEKPLNLLNSNELKDSQSGENRTVTSDSINGQNKEIKSIKAKVEQELEEGDVVEKSESIQEDSTKSNFLTENEPSTGLVTEAQSLELQIPQKVGGAESENNIDEVDHVQPADSVLNDQENLDKCEEISCDADETSEVSSLHMDVGSPERNSISDIDDPAVSSDEDNQSIRYYPDVCYKEVRGLCDPVAAGYVSAGFESTESVKQVSNKTVEETEEKAKQTEIPAMDNQYIILADVPNILTYSNMHDPNKKTNHPVTLTEEEKTEIFDVRLQKLLNYHNNREKEMGKLAKKSPMFAPVPKPRILSCRIKGREQEVESNYITRYGRRTKRKSYIESPFPDCEQYIKKSNCGNQSSLVEEGAVQVDNPLIIFSDAPSTSRYEDQAGSSKESYISKAVPSNSGSYEAIEYNPERFNKTAPQEEEVEDNFQCPICIRWFKRSEIERHASSCGEY